MDFGVITISPLISGHTTELTCFPLNNLVILERGDVAKLAGKAFTRRTHLTWDDFDQSWKFTIRRNFMYAHTQFRR